MDDGKGSVADLVFKKFDIGFDLVTLNGLMANGSDPVFRKAPPINSYPDFENFLSFNFTTVFHDFYVIMDRRIRNIVGYAYSYEFRLNDGHCKVFLWLKEGYRKEFLRPLLMQFSHKLLSAYSFRKIYSDLVIDGDADLEAYGALGFCCEGVLKEAFYRDKAFHDLAVLSLCRDSADEYFKKQQE